MQTDKISCPECGADLGEPTSGTYSNTGRDIRPVNPSHTGDVYHCEGCETNWLDNFITGQMEHWKG